MLHAFVGMAGLVAIAWAISEARGRIPWRTVAAGLLLALWILAPECASPTVHALLPEFRALAGIRTLVI